jgi:glycosyltransferase involved in cell wall biosynthesis
MSDLVRRITRFLQRVVNAVLRRLVLRTPLGVGPAAWQAYGERTRLHLARQALQGGRAAPARTLLAPLLDRDPEQPHGLALRAQVLELEGDHEGALDAARRATAKDAASVEAALVLAGLLDPAERRAVLERLIVLPPGSSRAAQEVIALLAEQDDAHLAERYEQLLRAEGREADADRADEVVAVLQVVDLHARDRDAALSLLDAQPVERRHRVGVLALPRLGEWDLLADLLDPRSRPAGDPAPKLAAGPASRAAQSALRAGRTSAAVRIAQAVLEQRPDNPRALKVLENGQDQLDVVAHRWQPPALASPSYEPRPRAALAVLSQSLPLRSGGYATRTHGVLTGLVARGWDVEAVTRRGFPYDRWPTSDPRTVAPFDEVDGVRYHRLLDDGIRRYPQYPLREYVGAMADGVVDIAARQRASLVHASSFYVTGLAAASAARRLGLPFIYEMRGLEDLMRVSLDPHFTDTDRYRFLEHVETEVCLEADKVLVITEALRREMARRGVPEERMVVLPNGVHVADFAPRERDAHLEAELGVQGVPVIGYAGGLVHYEGLELLFEAAARLKAAGVAFRVVVVGDGPHERVLRAEAERLRLGDVVTFTGRVAHDVVQRYLSLFDITPFPRLPLPVCELISPMKPFEAMAMRKAVVVSSVDALTEIVADERTGLVFAKGDADSLAATLRRLIDDPDLRARLGSAGYEWVRTERDWSTVTQVADEAYREVLDRAAATSA